jgi:hypothetical protein
MYTGLACLVLFDARGDILSVDTLAYIALALQLFVAACAYVPAIVHRPRLVDDMCADLITTATHAVGIAMIVSDSKLIYACALHSLCFLVQHRVLHKVQFPVLIHTITCLVLIAAYVHGPRINDIRQFVVSAVAPHALELAGSVMVHAHKFCVSWLAADM